MSDKEAEEINGADGADEMAPALDSLSLSKEPEPSAKEEPGASASEPKEEESPKPSDKPSEKPSEKAKEEEREVVVQLADGSTSLYAGVNAFEDLGLSEELLKGLYALGFQRPSKIQEKALPLLLANPPKNLIGQSQSGTGKTAAFALAMLSRIDLSNPSTQALCLSPARELARQSMDVLREMGKYTSVTTAYGIRDAVARGDKVSAQIVIGTPGTVGDLIKRRALDVSQVKMFVLDEADNMLDAQGLGDQSVRIKR
jgi:ATP-dependent RNA helicase DDX19/DBP5